MNITDAKWSAGVLTLHTTDPEAVRFSIQFKPGEYDIKPKAAPRSLTANNYAWVLIGKLSETLHMGKLEIYQNTIRDIGGNSDTLCMVEEAYPDFKRHWESRGDGWQTTTAPSKIPGCVVVTAYYGSSAYDTKQMSVLIDHLVQDCKSVGIETMPPDKLRGLLEDWNG